MTRRKSTARLWAGAKRPEQRYRDRQRITLPDGTRKEVFGYGRTKQAATDALAVAIRNAKAQTLSGASATVDQVMADLIRHKRTTLGRKRKTLYNNLQTYRLHIRPALGAKAIADVRLRDLEAVRGKVLKDAKYRTAELVTTLLKELFDHALRLFRMEVTSGDLRLYNVAADLEPITRPAGANNGNGAGVAAWSEAQVERFLEAAKARYDRSKKHLIYPLFHTAIAAGLRRGELLGLRRSALKSATVLVDGKPAIIDGEPVVRHYLDITEQLVYYGGRHHWDTPKRPSSVRRIPIGPELVAVLQAHMRKVDEVKRDNPDFDPECDLMFPSFNGLPMQPRNIYRAWHQLLAELKLPEAVLHDLRGVYTTYLIKRLVEQGIWSPKIIQALLGHSTPDVGLKHYARVVADDLESAVFDPVAGIAAGTDEKEEDAASEETAS